MLQTVIDGKLATKSFKGGQGGAEHFISVMPPATLSLREQVEFVQKRYGEALRSLDLSPETAIFRRIFLSDAMNQGALIRNSSLAAGSPENPVAVSIVQQPPLPGSKLALLAYHIEHEGHVRKHRLSMRNLVVEKNGTRHLWSTRLCAAAPNAALSSQAQTRKVFADLTETLAGLGANLRDHCIRTWIFLKGVDVFYQGMVDARRELFASHGLTSDTHYIASTGIEGACSHRFDLVSMDAYCNLDLAPQQKSFLNDFEHLCATKDYSVTFERGTQIAYCDRSHNFISGTASIDSAGEIMHRGDVLAQLERALLNVEALLRSREATLDDMMYWIVYLRDPTDFIRVDRYLSRRFRGMPILIVEGAVCRPEWLIEIEGVAVALNDDPSLPSF